MKILDSSLKMSSLQPVDLESANSAVNGGGAAVPAGGGGEIVVVVIAESDIGKDDRRESSVSECSVEMVDLEAALGANKVVSERAMRDCRICYLSLDITSNQDSGIPIELGCSCKDDLAAAHKQCAEAWFKIKGNKICEICGSIAQNVVGVNESEFVEQQSNETNDVNATAAPPPPARNFWQGHKFLNFLLACMVFAFVISWLFHFNVPA